MKFPSQEKVYAKNEVFTGITKPSQRQIEKIRFFTPCTQNKTMYTNKLVHKKIYEFVHIVDPYRQSYRHHDNRCFKAAFEGLIKYNGV